MKLQPNCIPCLRTLPSFNTLVQSWFWAESDLTVAINEQKCVKRQILLMLSAAETWLKSLFLFQVLGWKQSCVPSWVWQTFHSMHNPSVEYRHSIPQFMDLKGIFLQSSMHEHLGKCNIWCHPFSACTIFFGIFDPLSPPCKYTKWYYKSKLFMMV